ncbi:MAG TPA: 6,7-dimethyl-8-ribityllumazine synthase [Burkholderiaceae bacterium]|nr:6,7-dimethyl-8-ribityllumazine synthase [Burkholderiaceae bacterium]
MALDFIAPDFDGAELRIGVVQARFNEWAGRALAEACMNELITLGVDEDDITHVTVPGALEIPVALARLAATEDFDALIALGCVIRGETYHFEVVSNESARGVAQVSLSYGVPVANGIITTETDEQARARIGEKGRDAARVAVEMANLLLALDEDGDEDGDE